MTISRTPATRAGMMFINTDDNPFFADCQSTQKTLLPFRDIAVLVGNWVAVGVKFRLA